MLSKELRTLTLFTATLWTLFTISGTLFTGCSRRCSRNVVHTLCTCKFTSILRSVRSNFIFFVFVRLLSAILIVLGSFQYKNVTKTLINVELPSNLRQRCSPQLLTLFTATLWSATLYITYSRWYCDDFGFTLRALWKHFGFFWNMIFLIIMRKC